MRTFLRFFVMCVALSLPMTALGLQTPVSCTCPTTCASTIWMTHTSGNYAYMCNTALDCICSYKCLAGYYRNGMALLNNPPTCTQCDAGYTSPEGATSESQCCRTIACNQNTTCSNHYGASSCTIDFDAEQEECQDNVSDLTIYLCPMTRADSCRAGHYMTYNGTYNGTPTNGNACPSCDKGYSCAGGTANREQCDTGTYQDETGKSSCKDCPNVPSGWSAKSITPRDDATACRIQQTPTYCDSGIVQKKYNKTTEAYELDTYKGLSAAAGAFVDTDSTDATCTLCVKGSYGSTSASTNTTCSVCSKGYTTNSDGSAGAAACTKCTNNTSYVQSFKDPEWNSNNTMTNDCVISACKTGYIPININTGDNINQCNGLPFKVNYITGVAGTTITKHSCLYNNVGLNNKTYLGTSASSFATCKIADTPATMKKNGYTFGGWKCYLDTNSTTPCTGDAANVLLQAGSTAIKNATTTYADDIYLIAQWNKCDACTATAPAECSVSTNSSNQCVYTTSCPAGYTIVNNGKKNPSCTPNVYTITLDDNGGSGGSGTIYLKFATGWYSNSGATTTLSAATPPTKTNSVFSGYYNQNASTRYINHIGVLPDNDTFTANTTLYAKWCACTKDTTVTSCSTDVDTDGTCLYSVTACATGYDMDNATCDSNGNCSCGNLAQYDCNAGYYLPKGKIVCELCPSGKYCEAGSYNYNSSADQGITGDITAGYFSSGGGKKTTPTSSNDCAGNDNTCGACPNWSFSEAGAGSCTDCPTVTDRWEKISKTETAWTQLSQCVQITTPSGCNDGKIKQVAASTTSWGKTEAYQTLSAQANRYTTSTECKPCPNDYPISAGGEITAEQCYKTCQNPCTINEANCPTGSTCEYENTMCTAGITYNDANNTTTCQSCECQIKGQCRSSVPCSELGELWTGTYNECTNNADAQCQQQCNVPCSGKVTCHDNATCTYNENDAYTGFILYKYNEPVACPTAQKCPIQSYSCAEDYYYKSDRSGCGACTDVDATDETKTETIQDGTEILGTRTATCIGKHTGGPGGTKGGASCTGCSSWGNWVPTCNEGYDVSGETCVEHTYTINYYTNGGTNHDDNPSGYTINTIFTFKTPTRNNSTFEGWYTDSAFTKKITKITTGNTGNLKLYAKWSCNPGYHAATDAQSCVVNTFTVKYAAGVGGAGTVPTDNSCTYGTKTNCTAETPDNLSKTDSTFKGWTYKNQTYNPGDDISKITTDNDVTVTLTATWGTCSTCSVGTGIASCTMNANNTSCNYTATCSNGYNTPTCNQSTGACSCTPNTFNIVYKDGTKQVATQECKYNQNTPDCTLKTHTAVKISKTGHTFANWSFSNQEWTPGFNAKTITTGTSDVVMVAQWKANVFYVSYASGYANGSAPTAPTQCTYGVKCSAPANSYTKNLAQFTNWQCTGGIANKCDGNIIAPGTDISKFQTENGEVITLTAVWQCNAETYLNANGACMTCPDNAYCYGDEIITCFSGFYLEANKCRQCPTDSLGYQIAVTVSDYNKCDTANGTDADCIQTPTKSGDRWINGATNINQCMILPQTFTDEHGNTLKYVGMCHAGQW